MRVFNSFGESYNPLQKVHCRLNLHLPNLLSAREGFLWGTSTFLNAFAPHFLFFSLFSIFSLFYSFFLSLSTIFSFFLFSTIPIIHAPKCGYYYHANYKGYNAYLPQYRICQFFFKRYKYNKRK
jgi:hypothetical protein